MKNNPTCIQSLNCAAHTFPLVLRIGCLFICISLFIRACEELSAGTFVNDLLIPSEVAKLAASDAAAGDQFGDAVAVSGNTIVVGSFLHDDIGSDSGSAYVFERDQGGAENWGQFKKLTPSDPTAGDNFGNEVSISGDFIVVSAPNNDAIANNAGAVYIFDRNHGGMDNWGQVKKLTANDVEANDEFGSSVSISGDTLVVGVVGDDDAGSFSGSAYIFQRNYGGTDNWGQVKKLTASDGAASDRFGGSVAISGDTVVVGSSRDSDAGTWSGSSYVFERSEGGTDHWGEVTKLTASDAAEYDFFGGRVAISGDTIVIGASGDDDGGDSSGAAYIFERNEGGIGQWGQLKKLTASDAEAGDSFASVAISGDIIVVGASGDDDVNISAGAAYILERNEGGTGNWGEVAKITASDGAFDDIFGNGVSISGDTVVVGARRDDDGSSNSGSAYVFLVDRLPPPCLEVTNLDDSGPGSLREAILCANSHPGPDTITFAVAGTIHIADGNPLPALSDTTGGTRIDGSTAPGFAGAPVVVISDPLVNHVQTGLEIISAQNVVHAVQVSGFTFGIKIAGDNASGNVLTGNYIGTDGVNAMPNFVTIEIDGSPNTRIGTNSDGVDDAAERNVIVAGESSLIFIHGLTATGNIISGNYIGTDETGSSALGPGTIFMDSGDNRIGGTAPSAANLIIGNVSISGSTANGNVIQGNYFGLDINGATKLGAGSIHITDGSNNLIGGTLPAAKNRISGEVRINNAQATGNMVQGNYIGTDESGTSAFGGTSGLAINKAINNTIGGTSPEARNVISGGYGIWISGAGNIVQGNFIGTDATGTIALGNTRGIHIVGNAVNLTTGNIIGGVVAGAGNLISGNQSDGILIEFGSETLVQGNLIGTDISGELPLGNGTSGFGDGIEIRGPRNTIGGNVSGAGNVIVASGGSGINLTGDQFNDNIIQGNYIGTDASGTLILGNGNAGIRLQQGLNTVQADNNIIGGESPGEANVIAFNGYAGVYLNAESTGNAILANAIFSNADLGIRLSNNFGNDPGDSDTGPNNKQNYPELASAIASSEAITIEGSLNSIPNATFTIELFANTECDPSGFGEGEVFIGSTIVNTAGSGKGYFIVNLPLAVPVGHFITSTATDAGNNTSEFSQCAQVLPPPPPNQPPVANAGFDQTVECTSNLGTSVTLDGSGSSDPDGADDIVSYVWSEGVANLGTGVTINTSLSLGTHQITLTVTDAVEETDTDTVQITVQDTTAPVITLNGAANLILECAIDSYTELGAGVFDACDATVSVVIGGHTLDDHMPGTYVVTYDATDASGNVAAQVTRTVTVQDTTAPVITLNGASGLTLECAIDTYSELGASVFDACDSSVSVVIGGDAVDNHTPGIYVVTYEATDTSGNVASQVTRTVTVQDTTAPEITIIEPASGYIEAVGNLIPFAADIEEACELQNAVWKIQDFYGQVTELAASISGSSEGLYAADDLFSFGSPGIYSITLVATDAFGNQSAVSVVTDENSELLPAYVVIYDPAGGFVTGGGWIWSPEGAFHPEMAEYAGVTGKATFGFVAKYKNGANTPSGNTEFQFKAGHLNFKSSAYEWLVVAGNRAQYKGWGLINGEGNFQFMLTGIDGDLSGGDGNDRFRIKIWVEETGEVIYDNKAGAADDVDSHELTILGGGNVVIHKAES